MLIKNPNLAQYEECSSLFFSAKSEMRSLCPECPITYTDMKIASTNFIMVGVLDVIGTVALLHMWRS